MKVKVGCCGFPIKREKYFQQLKLFGIIFNIFININDLCRISISGDTNKGTKLRDKKSFNSLLFCC